MGRKGSFAGHMYIMLSVSTGMLLRYCTKPAVIFQTKPDPVEPTEEEIKRVLRGDVYA